MKNNKFKLHDLPQQSISPIVQKFALFGTPNVGKSTFFNHITNKTTMTSNVDRLTVNATIGNFRHNRNISLTDLPGVYNLSHPLDEEQVVAENLYHTTFDKIINIVGSQSIERDLFLTIQLIETGMLSNLIINMIDEVPHNYFNIRKLSKKLNDVNIVCTQANKNKGIKESTKLILQSTRVNCNVVNYGEEIETLIKQISTLLPESNLNKRFLALALLEGNTFFINKIKLLHITIFKKIQKLTKNKNYFEQIANAKKTFIKQLLETCINTSVKENDYQVKVLKQRRFDRCLLYPWVGIPLFILLIAIVYFIAFGPWTGGGLQDLLQTKLFDNIVLHWIRSSYANVSTVKQWFGGMFVDGLLQSIFNILSYIPTIFILFFLVNIINQVGLLSRISVLLDRALSRFGLSGRAIITVLTGFGCAVPAILLARSSNSKKERIISILITPFLSCSAKIIVIGWLSSTIIGGMYYPYSWLFVLGAVLLSGIIALLMGLIFSKTLFRNHRSFFIIEMVNYRFPDFIVICKLALLQIWEFIRKCSTIIIGVGLLIWLLTHIMVVNFSHWIDHAYIDSSILAYIGKGLQYLFVPIGFGNIAAGHLSNDGWKLSTSLLSALPAKEIAIANISVLYPSSIALPLNEVLSYMTMLLFMMPCGGTISVIAKETNKRIVWLNLWTSFVSAYALSMIMYWTCSIFVK